MLFRSALYQDLLDGARARRDIQRVASALSGLGDVAAAEGDEPTARRFYDESLGLFRELQDRWGIAGVLCDLGNLLRDSGAHENACEHYHHTLLLFRELGYRRGIARVLECMTICAASQGLAVRALTLAGAAATVRRELGTPALPAEREELDRILASLQQTLPPLERSQAWAAGSAMTTKQALDYALAMNPSS